MKERKSFGLVVALASLALAGVLAGCSEPGSGDEAAAAPVNGTESVALAESAAPDARDPGDGGAEGEGIRIYRDLTAYDWYRRGEPLLVGGEPYIVEGVPVRITQSDVRPAGRHGGVEFYVHENDREPVDAVLVPVFPGYWQPFVPEQRAPSFAD